MKHAKPRRGQDYRPQPGANSATDSFQYDIATNAKLAEITRAWGLDPDAGIGQTADGKLQFQGPDESNGVEYGGGAQTADAYIPKVRKLSNPFDGMPGSESKK